VKKKKDLPKVIVDVSRMKYPFTGLYFYCKNLALNLEKYHSNSFDFSFFSYPKVVLPKNLKQVVGTILDKFFFDKKNDYKLFHGTWQGTKYIPQDNAKFVLTIHDLNFLYTNKSKYKKQKLLKKIQKRVNKADAITVISTYVKNDILKHLDLKGKPVDVIYNGVELLEFPDFDKPKYRPENKFLFTVGTVLYKKHFHVLPRLLVDNDYELVIAGIHPEKSYIAQIEEDANKYGVGDRVHLVGAVSDEEKYWYVKNSEAFLFPSISEGFGLPPIEAMLLGKPVFMSTFTSLPEVGGDAAYYFESFDADAMKQVLKEGLEDYNTNNRKQEIIAWASQFSWESSVKGYVAVYNRVLGNDDSAPKNSINLSKEGKQKVTAIIPTYNEEVNIKDAIRAVSFADEILVIDSKSTDNTVALAEELGVKIIQREFDDFSSQKNYAIRQAKYDWVFILDADERVSDTLKNEIGMILDNPTKAAYSIRRENYFAGKKIKYSGWQTDKVIRLFNRHKAKYNGKIVHEEVETTGELGMLTNKLTHYTYRDYNHYFQKINHYAELKAIELYKQGRKATVFHFIFPPLFRFVSHYFIRLGFLDGFPGFMIARIQSYGVFIRYNRLWLKNRKLD
jgi:glycosyltransferase involved in cell wall biosynthesis